MLVSITTSCATKLLSLRNSWENRAFLQRLSSSDVEILHASVLTGNPDRQSWQAILTGKIASTEVHTLVTTRHLHPLLCNTWQFLPSHSIGNRTIKWFQTLFQFMTWLSMTSVFRVSSASTKGMFLLRRRGYNKMYSKCYCNWFVCRFGTCNCNTLVLATATSSSRA